MTQEEGFHRFDHSWNGNGKRFGELFGNFEIDRWKVTAGETS